jgi:hypothetical protein
MSTGRSTRRRWFQFGLLVIAVWMLVGWLSYKMREGRPVEFIVPMNFQGTIEVVLDEDSGERMELKNGSYVLTVPQSGVILVTDTGPFRRWHKDNCRDVDGNIRTIKVISASYRENERNLWEVR